jgi:hypothetical protein
VAVFIIDLADNTLATPFSWTFGVQEPPCGRAEFSGLSVSSAASAFGVNSATPLVDGVISIAAYNPTHKDLSWVQNTRIEKIDLLYRKLGSSPWQPALDINGDPAAFYDDVRVRVLWLLLVTITD